jgi:OMF family outer membrane factor
MGDTTILPNFAPEFRKPEISPTLTFSARLSHFFFGNLALLLLVWLPAQAAPTLPVPGQPPPTYSLNDCLQLALERNPQILKAQKDIERTQGLVITAKSTLYPQVSLNGRLEERNDDLLAQGSDPTIQRFRDFWVIQIIATQSLYSGGINRQQIAIAKLQHQNSMIQFQGTIDAVLKNVKYAVYAVVVDEAQIVAQQDSINLLVKQEEQQKALFDAGRTTKFNVLRVQVNIGNQRSVLYQTQDALTAAQIALAQLLNIEWPRKASPFNPPFTVQQELVCPPVENLKVDELIGLAMSRRPELQVLDRQIDIAERQVKIDKAALVPKIDAYVSDQDLRDQTVSSFDQSVNSYAIGFLGTWNVFDGFASKGETISDTATLGTAHISRDQMGLQIQSEVREAYARLLTAQQTVQSQAETVKTAEQSVGLAQLSADTGYATLLDVLQATLDLTAARTQAIQTKQQYLDALADLEKAISLKFVDWPKDGVTSNSPAPAPVMPAAPATPPGVVR